AAYVLGSPPRLGVSFVSGADPGSSAVVFPFGGAEGRSPFPGTPFCAGSCPVAAPAHTATPTTTAITNARTIPSYGKGAAERNRPPPAGARGGERSGSGAGWAGRAARRAWASRKTALKFHRLVARHLRQGNADAPASGDVPFGSSLSAASGSDTRGPHLA